MSDTPFTPGRYDIVSAHLIGWQRADGSIELMSGSIHEKWPKTIVVGGVQMSYSGAEVRPNEVTKRGVVTLGYYGNSEQE